MAIRIKQYMSTTNRFRTVRISDPRFESDHLRFITVKSKNLKGRGNICVFVPPNTAVDTLPIVILLHGVYGSALSWSQQAGAHRTANRLINSGQITPMILVMPSDGLWGDGSAYLPHATKNFEKWISEDVPDVVRMHIPQAANSTALFISGLSMGGFGSLTIGAKNPDKFKAIAAHSALTSLEQMGLFVEEPLSAFRQKNPMNEDVFLTMQAHQATLPPVRFDCGKNDLLIEPNRQLHQQLTNHAIPHLYEEFEGSHEWPYWEAHLQDSLLFFSLVEASQWS